MNRKLLLTFLCALLSVPAFCQGLREKSINNILKDMYHNRKDIAAKQAVKMPPLKVVNGEDTFTLPAQSFEKIIEESKKEEQSFEDFLKINRPQEPLPEDLQNAFSNMLRQSVQRERGYYLKKNIAKISINDTCNLYAYYAARAVYNKKISLDGKEYKITDIYLVKVMPARNPNVGQGTTSVLGLPMLKTAEDTYNFLHENGSKSDVWNFHAAPIFVVRDKKGTNYFVVTDPFLYNGSVTFGEWIERFFFTSEVLIKRFEEDASLNNNRVYIKS